MHIISNYLNDVKCSKFFDYFFICSLGVGLFYSPALLAIPLMTFFKFFSGSQFKFFTETKFKFNWGYFLLFISTLWALIVVLKRGVDGNEKLLLQYLFIWTLPFLLIIYKPTQSTFNKLKAFVYLLFAFDLFFNFYTYFAGVDLLERQLDLRDGFLLGIRAGGIFAHSFYSGTISVLAYIFLIFEKRFRFIILFVIFNLILAGSARVTLLALIVPLFYFRWRNRTRKMEIIQVFLISSIIIGSVFLNSSFTNYGFSENGANDLRTVAWGIAISKISSEPIIGFGYPKLPNPDEGMSEKALDENLIAESWYLNAALTFGIPYLLLRYIGLMLIFYGGSYHQRSGYEAILVPCLLIDLAYGSALEGMLFYTVLWILIHSRLSLRQLNDKN